MRAYLDRLENLLENRVDQNDRTGTGTRSVFGRQLRFDLPRASPTETVGFPLLTTNGVPAKSIISKLQAQPDRWAAETDVHVRVLIVVVLLVVPPSIACENRDVTGPIQIDSNLQIFDFRIEIPIINEVLGIDVEERDQSQRRANTGQEYGNKTLFARVDATTLDPHIGIVEADLKNPLDAQYVEETEASPSSDVRTKILDARFDSRWPGYRQTDLHYVARGDLLLVTPPDDGNRAVDRNRRLDTRALLRR